MPDVDAIVIGSGAGGLAAAVALARAGERVLVLEQHDVPGGWCHSFRLDGHQFTPGVHYVGELGPGGRLREVYEGLGVAGDLVFLELNPDGYEHLLIGDEAFDVPRGGDRWIADLVRRFPHEAEGIRGYFATIRRMADELRQPLFSTQRANPLALPLRAPVTTRWGLVSLDRLLRRFVSDPMLRAVLSIQAGDHGLGPARAPAAVHACVQAHYLEGAWYPRGGGAAIPRAFVKALRRHGGVLRVNTGVARILVASGPGGPRAVGVRLEDGTEIRARRIVSNADPQVTLGTLVGEQHLSWRTRLRLRRTAWSVSSLSLFLAADLDLRAQGYDSGNYWYIDRPDVQATYDVASTASLDGDVFPGQFLTVTTLKDPSKGLGTLHTLESFAFVSYEAFRRWAHTRFGHRPSDYEDLKEVLIDRMLRGADRIIPGLSERVVFRDLGTPLTNEHYCRGTAGNVYGTEKSRWQIGPLGWPLRTEIAGLHLCGSSTTSHGVLGATMSGLWAAADALGCPLQALLDAGGPSLTTWPADDLSAWPVEVQETVALKRAARPVRAPVMGA